MDPPDPGEEAPLAEDVDQRPPPRTKINFVPVVLNIMLPWMVFVVLVTVSCFKFRHDHENIVDAIWAVATMIVLGLVIHLFLGTHHKTEAVVCGSLSFCFAIISAGCVSYLLYWLYFHSYFAITDLKAFGNVEVTKVQGQDLQDAGKIRFVENTHIDLQRSWHFKHHDVFCVAPLVQETPEKEGDIIPSEKGVLDFFVVGKNCCSIGASDYRCKGYDNPRAHAGVRILDAETLPFYRLAVEQAQTEYGYLSTYPIFLEWLEDPDQSVEIMHLRGLQYYLLSLAVFFFTQLVLTMLCLANFTWTRRQRYALKKTILYTV